ncbi:hypothetical protein K435DRAFT_587391, partial [Dendrothele bispora CBS 962.96]
MQRHDMLRLTSFKLKRNTFEQLADRFADVDPLTVHVVAERVARGNRVTANNEQERKVLKLMNEVRLIAAHVQGSPTSKLHRRNELRSMMMDKGMPSFFITINPADTHNPIV